MHACAVQWVMVIYNIIVVHACMHVIIDNYSYHALNIIMVRILSQNNSQHVLQSCQARNMSYTHAAKLMHR